MPASEKLSVVLSAVVKVPLCVPSPTSCNVPEKTWTFPPKLLLKSARIWPVPLPAVLVTTPKFSNLGSGSPTIEGRFRYLAHAFPEHLTLRTAFDPPLAQRIYAGADMFLVPSRFEPCGLTQLQSMAYGTVPVVRAVGGLRDTVLDPRSAGGNATGFCFYEFDPAALYQALDRAVQTFRNAHDYWQVLQRNGMTRDATWETSARQYRGLYGAL